MSRPTKTFSLRLPFPTYERLQKEASSFGQPVPNWIRSKLSGESSTELQLIRQELTEIRHQLTSLHALLTPQPPKPNH